MPVHTWVGYAVACHGMEIPLSKGVFTSYPHCSGTRKR